MKKLLFILTLSIAAFGFVACDDDDDDVTIALKDMPANAQSFLETHFPGQEPKRVEKDNDGYDVLLKNGFSIDFSLNGEWDDVDGHGQAIPESIVALIPAKIVEYVDTHYANQSITEINKELYGFEIELSNKIELKFDKEGNFLGIDR